MRGEKKIKVEYIPRNLPSVVGVPYTCAPNKKKVRSHKLQKFRCRVFQQGKDEPLLLMQNEQFFRGDETSAFQRELVFLALCAFRFVSCLYTVFFSVFFSAERHFMMVHNGSTDGFSNVVYAVLARTCKSGNSKGRKEVPRDAFKSILKYSPWLRAPPAMETHD